MGFLFWSVAGLSAFRFFGSVRRVRLLDADRQTLYLLLRLIGH